MAWVYAAYVLINLTLFTIKTTERWQSPVFGLAYVAVRARRLIVFRHFANAPQGAFDKLPLTALSLLLVDGLNCFKRELV